MDSCSCLESEHWRLVSTSHDSLQKILLQQVNLEKVWKSNHSKAKYRKDISSTTIDTCQDHRQDSVLAGCSGALRGYGFGKKARYRKGSQMWDLFFLQFFVFQLSFLELKFWVLQLYRDRQKSSMWLICWKNKEVCLRYDPCSNVMPSTIWMLPILSMVDHLSKVPSQNFRRESQQHHLISQDPLNYRCLPCSRMTIEEFFVSMSPG